MHKVMMKNPEDLIILSTYKNEPPPSDDFRKTHVFVKKDFKYTEKPNNVRRPTKEKMKKSKSEFIRWTENEANLN